MVWLPLIQLRWFFYQAATAWLTMQITDECNQRLGWVVSQINAIFIAVVGCMTTPPGKQMGMKFTNWMEMVVILIFFNLTELDTSVVQIIMSTIPRWETHRNDSTCFIRIVIFNILKLNIKCSVKSCLCYATVWYTSKCHVLQQNLYMDVDFSIGPKRRMQNCSCMDVFHFLQRSIFYAQRQKGHIWHKFVTIFLWSLHQKEKVSKAVVFIPTQQIRHKYLKDWYVNSLSQQQWCFKDQQQILRFINQWFLIVWYKRGQHLCLIDQRFSPSMEPGTLNLTTKQKTKKVKRSFYI